LGSKLKFQVTVFRFDSDLVEVEMGKRGRKPGTKQDGVSKLERSRMSARECRVRKKLRYEYLEELVQDREKAIDSLKEELEVYKRICEQIDNGVITDDVRRLVESDWVIKVEQSIPQQFA
jgi:hypothetical protein